MRDRFTASVRHQDASVLKEIQRTLQDVPEIRALPNELTSLTEEFPPDLALIDVPVLLSEYELNGEPTPLVIVLAKDTEHALEAFSRGALDYIPTPFPPHRLRRSINLAIQRLRERQNALLRKQLLELMSDMHDTVFENSKKQGNASESPSAQYLTFNEGDRICLVEVQKVDRIEADGCIANVHVGTEIFKIRKTLKSYEASLPDHFIRIHRSRIVNINHIASVSHHPNVPPQARLSNGEEVKISRKGRRRLEEYLEQHL